MNNLIKSVCLGTLLGIATAAAQAADIKGYTGDLAALHITEPSSDILAERGSAIIHEGGGVTRKYQWGGTHCSGKNLTEQSLNILARVVASRTIQVSPYYKPGAGGARCLVGYRLQDPTTYLD